MATVPVVFDLEPRRRFLTSLEHSYQSVAVGVISLFESLNDFFQDAYIDIMESSIFAAINSYRTTEDRYIRSRSDAGTVRPMKTFESRRGFLPFKFLAIFTSFSKAFKNSLTRLDTAFGKSVQLFW